MTISYKEGSQRIKSKYDDIHEIDRIKAKFISHRVKIQKYNEVFGTLGALGGGLSQAS